MLREPADVERKVDIRTSAWLDADEELFGLEKAGDKIALLAWVEYRLTVGRLVPTEMMWWTALFPNAGEKRWMSKTPPHGSQRWA